MLSSCLGVRSDRAAGTALNSSGIIPEEIPGKQRYCCMPWTRRFREPPPNTTAILRECRFQLRYCIARPVTGTAHDPHIKLSFQFPLDVHCSLQDSCFANDIQWILFTHSEPSVRSPRGLYIGDVTGRERSEWLGLEVPAGDEVLGDPKR